MTFSSKDFRTLADTIREAGRREIMPRFCNLSAEAVREKAGPLDLVTEADEAAERAIEAALHRAFPGCVVVGEEGTSADPSRLRYLAEADLAFVLDPLDGTGNFAGGVPLFGMMAAAVVRGEIVAGVLHDPVGEQAAGTMRGEGAWMEAPDGRRTALSVARPVPLGRMTGLTSWRYLPEPRRSVVCSNLPRLAASWDYRCACHAYRIAASGHCHFLFFNRLLPWDHAAGWLLHREAGGYSARFDGSGYDVTETGGGLICAPDRESWRALRDGLLGPEGGEGR